MTSRRTYQGAQPLLEIRRDEVEPACAGRWGVFDVLIAPERGDPVAFAAREARAICKTCPLLEKCHTENAEEPWLLAMTGKRITKPHTPTFRMDPRDRPSVVRYNQERARLLNESRTSDLRALIAAGTPFAEILERLKISSDGLYSWCRKNDHGDLWRQIKPPREPAVVSRRRRVA